MRTCRALPVANIKLKNEKNINIINTLHYYTLIASPLAFSDYAAIGYWKGFTPSKHLMAHHCLLTNLVSKMSFPGCPESIEILFA